jgi:hypothetical protein
MVHRLSRFLVPLTCACALACAAPAAASAQVAIGISDNGSSMFTSRYFTGINITTARVGVEWNAAVMKDHTDLNLTRAWLNAAQRAGVQPLVTFVADGGSAGNYIPSAKVYTAAIKAFIHDFPRVKLYTPWNEPDWVYRPGIANHPTVAASYFNALVANCHGCTVAAGDLYLPAPQLGAWIRAYKRGLRYRPAAWALHNYYDVRSHGSAQVRTLESLTSGQIWLTEISGVIRRGHWQYANQSSAAAAKDETYLFSMPKRFPRITRIYHYQWQGTVDTPSTGWDSGLLGPQGVPRPAYWSLAKAVGARRTVKHATRGRR